MCVLVYTEPKLTLIAEDARPSVGAEAATLVRVTHSSIRAVITRHTAVPAERVIQTH